MLCLLYTVSKAEAGQHISIACLGFEDKARYGCLPSGNAICKLLALSDELD